MTTADITTVPMSQAEEIRLANLEQVVIDGLQTFVQVGQALAAIRAGDLYRATHSTFAAYVKDRFGLLPSYAYRTMDAADIAAIVSPIGDIANEAQARELVGLEPDEARAAYQMAVDDTGGAPTARAIATARETTRNTPFSTRNTMAPIGCRTDRRRPLSDDFRVGVRDLEKVVAQLDRLRRDDRFNDDRAELARYFQDRVTEQMLILTGLESALDDTAADQ